MGEAARSSDENTASSDAELRQDSGANCFGLLVAVLSAGGRPMPRYECWHCLAIPPKIITHSADVINSPHALAKLILSAPILKNSAQAFDKPSKVAACRG